MSSPFSRCPARARRDGGTRRDRARVLTSSARTAWCRRPCSAAARCSSAATAAARPTPSTWRRSTSCATCEIAARIPAIALTTDTSLLTAAGNDIGFDHVFARQVEALAKPGDLLVIHSTSGNSPNVLRAAEAARAQAAFRCSRSARETAARCAPLADHSVVDPDDADRSRAGAAPVHRAHHLRSGGADAVRSRQGAREGRSRCARGLRQGGSPSARSSASRTRVRPASDPRTRSSPSSRALGRARRSTR